MPDATEVANVDQTPSDDAVFEQELQAEYDKMTGQEPTPEPTDNGEEPPADTSDETQEGGEQAQDNEPEPTDNGEEPPAETPAVDPEMAKLQKRQENLDALLKRQAEELGTLRKRDQELSSIERALETNPNLLNMLQGQQPVQQQQGQDFDFTDPNAIKGMIKQEAQSLFQQYQQQQAQELTKREQQHVLAATEVTRANMIASGDITEADLQGYNNNLMSAIKTGKTPEVAFVYANHAQMLKDAESKGYNKAIAELNKKTDLPVTLSKAASSQKQQGLAEDYNSMSAERLEELYQSMPSNSKELPKIIKAFEKQMKGNK